MVTLNLTDTQAVILDALFRNHSTEEDIDLVKKEFKEFLKNDAHDPLNLRLRNRSKHPRLDIPK